MRQIQGDLLECPEEMLIAHCISSDFKLGAGVAKSIDEKFGVRKLLFETKLLRSFPCVIWTGRIANLVTKERFFNKPLISSLFWCVETMIKEMLDSNKGRVVAIPKIGCGLDRLSWDVVKAFLLKKEIDSSVEFVVYHK